MFSPSLGVGIVDVDIFGLFTINKEIISTFFDGCLASGAVWLTHTLQERLES